MNDPTPSKLLPISVAVLMGGRSERFGSPKAFLPYEGKSLAAHLLGEASLFSRNVFSVAREPDQVPRDARGYPIVTDLWEEEGPLAGLHAALSFIPSGVLFLCAVDMPFLRREVVDGLLEKMDRKIRPQVVVPRIGNRWEPLCSLWGKEALEVLRPGDWGNFQGLLSEGPLRVRVVTEVELRVWDPNLDCLRNFNTKEEWERSLSVRPQGSRM